MSVVMVDEGCEGGMVVWSYPGCLEELNGGADVLRNRYLRLRKTSKTKFACFRYKRIWQYLLVVEDIGIGLYVTSEEYDLRRYKDLLKSLLGRYVQSGNSCPRMLDLYLETIIQDRGEDIGNEQSIAVSKFLYGGSLVRVVELFGVEAVLLWNAVLLKRRIAVLCSDAGVLQRMVFVMPQFCWHRQDSSFLRPLVNLEKQELDDLREDGAYCAGFVDSRVRSEEGFYDLFVDLDSVEITVPDHAKDILAMCKLHKDVAESMVRVAEEGDDQALIKTIAMKTKALIDEAPKHLSNTNNVKVHRFISQLALVENIKL